MTISQISEMYDLTPHTLRYYEKIGLIPPVPRNSSGIRDYDDESCRWVEFIKCFRKAGIPIETLIEYVDLFQQGDTTKELRRQLLINELDSLNERIDELVQTRDRLLKKIEHYDNLNESCDKSIIS